jgi:hypothetical protein
VSYECSSLLLFSIRLVIRCQALKVREIGEILI